MRRVILALLFAAATVVSGGCYVSQDQNGQWWACDDYQTPNGVATGCAPIAKPF